jgi:hypothetical protein
MAAPPLNSFAALFVLESPLFRKCFSAAIHSLIHVQVVCLRAASRRASSCLFVVALARAFIHCARLRRLREVRRNPPRLVAAGATAKAVELREGSGAPAERKSSRGSRSVGRPKEAIFDRPSLIKTAFSGARVKQSDYKAALERRNAAN